MFSFFLGITKCLIYSYMNDLEAIDRIRIAAIQSKEKKLEPHMPKQLR